MLLLRSGDTSFGLCVMEALFWVFSFGGMPGAQVLLHLLNVALPVPCNMAVHRHSCATAELWHSCSSRSGRDLIIRRGCEHDHAHRLRSVAYQAERIVSLGLRLHIAALVEEQLPATANVSGSDRLMIGIMCKVLRAS